MRGTWQSNVAPRVQRREEPTCQEFFARLAALIPRPRAHLVTYHSGDPPEDHFETARPEPCSHREVENAESKPRKRRPSSWAELFRRVSRLDGLVCHHCGGPRKLLAAILEGDAIRKVLAHLGVATEPPPVAPARPPPGRYDAFLRLLVADHTQLLLPTGPNELLRVWLKEILVGAINGVALGLLVAAVAWLWKGNVWLGLVVGVAMAANTMVAVSVGGLIPLVLERLGRDPALASSPILTTVTDMCGFFLVLGLATLAMPYLR